MTDETTTEPGQHSVVKSDLIGAAFAAVIFAVALGMTFEWSDKAAMFPRVITGSGLLFSMAYLLACIVRARRAQKPDYATSVSQSLEERVHGSVQEHSSGSDDDLPPEEVEYVFATAGRKAWLSALGWVTLFLVLTLLLGLFVASAIFAFVYLRWSGSTTWLFSSVYALILSVCLILIFRVVTFVPTPLGILTGL
jgi:hypothetical protein